VTTLLLIAFVLLALAYASMRARQRRHAANVAHHAAAVLRAAHGEANDGDRSNSATTAATTTTTTAASAASTTVVVPPGTAPVGGPYEMTTGAQATHIQLSNGVVMPRVGFGTAGLRDSRRAVAAALDAGYTLIDTAAQVAVWYRNEIAIGDVLADRGGRDDIFITTKVHPQDHGATRARRSVDASLVHLRTTYVDLVLLHFPECWGDICDQDALPVEGTWRDSWRVLEALYDEKKIRAIGVSNFRAWQLDELHTFARIQPHVIQTWFDPYEQATDVRERCSRYGWHFQAYSTLGSQWWSTVHANPVIDRRWLHERDERHALLRVAARHPQRSLAQLVLRWSLQHGVSVVPKSNNAQHIAENIDVFDARHRLDDDDVRAIDALGGTLRRE